jgi:S1-C subfamily serine protease
VWVTIGSGEGKGVSVHVEGERFLVGSGDECQLMVGDPKVAPLHAYFEVQDDGRVLLHDLGSDEGTWVDGKKIDAPAHIQGGEHIRVGDTELVPAVQSPEEEARERAAHSDDEGSDDAPVRVTTGDGDTIEVVPEHAEGEGPHLRVRSEGEAVEVVPVGEHRRLRERITMAMGLAALAGLAAIGALVVFLATRGEDGASTSEIAADARPRTVLIDAKLPGGGEANGTGFVLDAEKGLVVTNFHVVNGGRNLLVGVDGDPRDATLYSAAPCEDLAVLKVEDTAGMKSFPLGSQRDVKEGDRVVAVGYPVNAGNDATLTSTEGVVSVARSAVRVPIADAPFYSNVIQTDAALNPGNSGGPLIDDQKRVVGVNATVLTRAAGAPIQGQGYAIGVDHLKEALGTLRSGRSQGYAGFGIVPGGGRGGPVRAERMDGPKGGFLLAAVNGTPVRGTFPSYCDAVRPIESGQTAVLTVMARAGAKPEQLKIKFR